MNYLAHAALTFPQPQLTLGNLIADHVRGRNLSYLPLEIELGVRLHRQIDSYFDNHPAVAQLRSLMPQGFRRYSGIAIDFWFDHLLATHWSQFYPSGLIEFQRAINQLVAQHWQWVPESQRGFMDYLVQQELFLKYRSQTHIRKNLQLVAHRLRQGDRLIETMERLSRYGSEIEQCFATVYPEVQHYCRHWIQRHPQSNSNLSANT